MLDKMRQHSRSFIIYIFFGIIIAVFVINFGPQSQGCVADTSYAGRVADRKLTVNDINYALSVAGLRSTGLTEDQLMFLQALVIDRYLVRELMAEKALELGLRIPDREIEDMLLKGRYLALGEPRPMVRGENEAFDYDLFSRYVRYNWGTTVKKFKEEQRRELLAEKVRALIGDTTLASESEAKADYLHRNTQAQIKYVRFAPAELRDQVPVPPEKVQAFTSSQAARIKQFFETNKTAYQKLPEQVRLRILELAVPTPAEQQAVKKRAEQVAARLRKGEEFSKLASEVSTHASAVSGGWIGWRNVDTAGLGEALDKVARQLQPGQTSEVIEADGRFVLLRAEARRKGDVSLEQAQDEIAVELLREEGALELARDKAKETLALVKGGKALTDLFAPAQEASTTTSQPDQGGQTSAPSTSEPSKGEASGPKIHTSSFFTRSPDGLVPGIGASPELSAKIFETKEGELVGEPVTVSSIVYVVLVEDREDADLEEWQKRKDELVDQYEQQKAALAVRQLEHDLCTSAVKDRRLSISPGVLAIRAGADQQPGGRPAPAYEPCKTLEATGGSLM